MKETLTRQEIFDLSTLLKELFSRRKSIISTKELVQHAAYCNMVAGDHYQTFKDLYDVAEFALNEFIFTEELTQSIEDNSNNIMELQSLLPAETERSVDQSIYQQFSTPLVASYYMSLLSNPHPNDNYCEPSAGTGSLATFIAKREVRSVIVNEIHQHRYKLLSSSKNFTNCYKEDATQIHNLPKFFNSGITKIVMNPPFSRHINTNSKVDILAGAKHLISAFKLLSDKGTIVLLINENFKAGSKAFKHFQKYAPSATCTLNTVLDPTTFVKKGTKFLTRIMVIHNYDTGKKLFMPNRLNASSVQEYLSLIS